MGLVGTYQRAKKSLHAAYIYRKGQTVASLNLLGDALADVIVRR